MGFPPNSGWPCLIIQHTVGSKSIQARFVNISGALSWRKFPEKERIFRRKAWQEIYFLGICIAVSVEI
jgi:hypothetical protein